MNIKEILVVENVKLTNTVKITVYLSDIGDFSAVYEVYAEFFAPPYPVRVAYQVAALPKGAKVEIKAIAEIK